MTRRWFARWRAPEGRSLQERYPAAPGAFTTSYTSADLSDDAFVQLCPWCGGRAPAIADVPVKVIQCRDCARITKIELLDEPSRG